MKVWKFPVTETIEMPANARIIHVGTQEGPTLWAIVEPKNPKVKRTFLVTGTGDDIPIGARYLGTTFDGPFVWHVFETI